MAERSRKLWTTRGVLMVKHAFYSKPFPQFSPDFPLTWWRRMALSTVSFVVDTRIDHRFAIQTELNDGPCSLSALRFISRFIPPPFPSSSPSLYSLHPVSVVISLLPLLPRSILFRSRVHLSVIFPRKKRKTRVVSTVCKSSDQSIESGRGRERTREET